MPGSGSCSRGPGTRARQCRHPAPPMWGQPPPGCPVERSSTAQHHAGHRRCSHSVVNLRFVRVSHVSRSQATHAGVKNYYAALHQVGQLHFNNEAQVSDAFAKLLADCGRKLHLTFIPQFPIQRARNRVIVDGALLDTFRLAHGYWEAKDDKDDLDREIKAKLDKGYPRDNIIFQAPRARCSSTFLSFPVRVATSPLLAKDARNGAPDSGQECPLDTSIFCAGSPSAV